MVTTYAERIASTDSDYVQGSLSLYPTALDTPQQLYVVANNAQTTTAQSSAFNSTYFIVADTSGFPAQGLIQIGTEQIYYNVKTPTSFSGLQRGFAGSQQNAWPINTPVYGAVFAEPHNTLKDAAINLETNLGIDVNPASLSLNGILTQLETIFLAPRPVFLAYPRTGVAPLTVSFQNFSECPALRYLWDFGDGATSQDFAPTHTFLTDGSFTITLTVITVLGAQGIVTKSGYILIGSEYAPSFFYVTPQSGSTSTTFTFNDQSTGQITIRYWTFGDGNTLSVSNPAVNTATHQFNAGTYNPSLLLIFADGSKKIVYLPNPIVVS
jgi:PKD repeat protein